MSLNLTLPTTAAAGSVADPHRMHRLRLRLAYLLAVAGTMALLVYGLSYYWSSPAQRALSPKHDYLKPSGAIGLRLGLFGVLLFLFIYVYPLRKKWAWLGRQGSSKRWLDFHVLLGLVAPVVVTFHSSFKFSGIAGVAYWIMIVVAFSGVVGRYIYAQIPRSLNSAELTLQQAQDQSVRTATQLKNTAGAVPLPHLPCGPAALDDVQGDLQAARRPPGRAPGGRPAARLAVAPEDALVPAPLVVPGRVGAR